MKCKKLIFLIVAVLMLSLTTTALAANNQTRYTASISLPDIKIDVVVPSATRTYLNPKQIPVKVGGRFEDNSIISDMAYIENKSIAPVNVSVSVAGAVKSSSNMTLASTTFDPDATTAKKAFLFFDMEAISDPSDSEWWKTWSGNVTFDKEKHIPVTTTEKSKKDIVTLAAYDEDNPNTKRYGAFRLTGVCTTAPKSEWTAKDGVSATITFTFRALPLSTEIN